MRTISIKTVKGNILQSRHLAPSIPTLTYMAHMYCHLARTRLKSMRRHLRNNSYNQLAGTTYLSQYNTFKTLKTLNSNTAVYIVVSRAIVKFMRNILVLILAISYQRPLLWYMQDIWHPQFQPRRMYCRLARTCRVYEKLSCSHSSQLSHSYWSQS